MTGFNRMAKNFMIVLLAGVLLIAAGVVRSQSQSSMSGNSGQTTEALFIKGKVKKISFETKTILIKPKKGETVSITFHEQTTLIGFDSFDEIKKKQPVRIWYTIEGENNKAVKIEKAPEVGC